MAGATAGVIGRVAVAVAASGGMQARLEDHREAWPAASRHPDDVSRTQLRQGSRRLGPADSRPGPEISSRSVKDLLSCAYSAKSPLSQLIAAASSSNAWRFLRTCRVSPMTERSACNCANEDSSR